MRLIITFITLLTIQNIFADQPRLRYSFKSPNGYFELNVSDMFFSDKNNPADSIFNKKNNKSGSSLYNNSKRYHWGLYDVRTNQKLYSIKNDSLYIEAKTAMISDNGKQIIIVDDFSSGFGFQNLEVVHFYRTTELIKTITLGELLDNMCSPTYSVSHMTWCFGFKFTSDNTFEINTYEYFNYKFDLNGNLIEKSSDRRIKPTDEIVTAEIKRIAKDKYSFNIRKSIRNKYEPGTKIILTVSDKTMRKIHGKFYGFIPARNRRMETEFIQVVLFRNDNPIYSDILFPNYNGNQGCNVMNKINSR